MHKVGPVTGFFFVPLMRASIVAFTLSLLLLPPLKADDAHTLWAGGVQQLLDQHCVKCHGPLKKKNGLELDTMEGALKGSDDGAVIAPGKPEGSKLIEALAADADPHMPPKKQLGAEEIEKLRVWIKSLGAEGALASVVKADSKPIPDEPAAAIDHFLSAAWQARGLAPEPLCDDATFVRRVFLDLAGRIPTRAEADAFLYDARPAKRTSLVDRLLASDEYSRTFREIWDAILMGRGAGRREQRRRENGWFTFLERAFKENRPWNEIVEALIVARSDKPADLGALWFLYERRNEHQRIAEALAPVIYGTRLDCAQCHDHPLAREIKQAHYWGLIAAFNRSKNVEKGAPAVGESATGGFVNFTNLKKESQPAAITLLTGRTIQEARPTGDSKELDCPDDYVDPGAAVKVPKFSRRAALAGAATHDNPLLARAFVNHTWAILMGRGIVHPVDEMNSKHPPSHPELLDWLAKDFALHGYDVRRLVRSIAASRAYQLARHTGANSPPADLFAASVEKPLIAETLARSVLIAAERNADEPSVRRTFAEAFGDVLPRVARATVQQAMLLGNDDTLVRLFTPAPGDAAERLGAISSLEERVREAFRLALIRQPDAEELARAVEFLNAGRGSAGEAAGELLWALVTGPEFLTNH